MSAEGLELIGKLGLEAIRKAGWEPDFVGGLTLGADPVAYSVAVASRWDPPVVDAFTVRKNPKSHGMGRKIEGCFEEKGKVVVVEDVITTAGQVCTSIGDMRDVGLETDWVVCAVDRQQGGGEKIAEAGCTLHPAFTLEEIERLVGDE